MVFFQISGASEAIQEALMQITARLRNHLFRDRMASTVPNVQPPFGLVDPQFGSYAGNHDSISPRIFPNVPQFHKDFIGRPLDEMSAPWTMKVSIYVFFFTLRCHGPCMRMRVA